MSSIWAEADRVARLSENGLRDMATAIQIIPEERLGALSCQLRFCVRVFVVLDSQGRGWTWGSGMAEEAREVSEGKGGMVHLALLFGV